LRQPVGEFGGVRYQRRHEKHLSLWSAMHDLGQHQFGNYAASVPFTEEMCLVQHAQRESRECLGILPQRQRALLRSHDQDLTIINFYE